MDPITLDQLRVFLSVAQEGSFSAAARHLHRTQSAVSYAIANLERLLEVSLFERSGRRPALSEAGRALLSDAHGVIHGTDRLLARARGHALGVEAEVALAVDSMFPHALLTTLLGEFRETYPAVDLRLHVDVLGGVAELVAQGVCDLGIGSPLADAPMTLERHAVGPVTLCGVVANSHPLAQIAGTIPEEVLEAHIQIVLTDRSALTQGRDHGVLAQRTWRVRDLAVKHSLLRAGLGWGGMPYHLVAADLDSGHLVRIRPAPWGDAVYDYALEAMWRRADPPGPATRWLCDRIDALTHSQQSAM